MSFFITVFLLSFISIFLVVKNRYSALFIGILIFGINFLIINFVSSFFTLSVKDGIISILSIAIVFISSIAIILLPRKDGKSIFYIEEQITTIH